MKNLLLIFSVLLSTSLSAVEFGFFMASAGDSETNKVTVGMNQFIEFPQFSHSEYVLESGDILVAEYDDEIIELPKSSSHWAFAGKKIYGPCILYLRINPSGNTVTRFLPYKLSNRTDVNTSENLLVIPANASDNHMDLIVQESNDSITWSNIIPGLVNQIDSPKFFRLLLSNVNNETISANNSFGFGSSNPTSSVLYRKVIEPGQSGSLVTLSEGQLFVPLYPMFGDGEIKVYAYINPEFSNAFVCGFNNEQVEAFPGPAVLSHSSNNSDKAMMINYIIQEEIAQGALSGGIVSIPSGSGSYQIGIEYSDDLINWEQMAQGAQPAPSDGIRFYRLSALSN